MQPLTGSLGTRRTCRRLSHWFFLAALPLLVLVLGAYKTGRCEAPTLLAQASAQRASEQGSAQPQAEDAERQQQREQADREIYRRNRLAAQVKTAMMWLSVFPALLCNWLLTKVRFLEPWSRLFLSVFFGALVAATIATFVVQLILLSSLAVVAGAHGSEVLGTSALVTGCAAVLLVLGKTTFEFARKH